MARHGLGDEGKALGCVPPTALLFRFRSHILTSIKDADCDPVVGIMGRAFCAKGRGLLEKLRPPNFLVAYF
jgi:hypothetical protein